VEPSDVPGDDCEISPGGFIVFVVLVGFFVGFLADASAESSIESRTWVDFRSFCTLTRSFSALAIRWLGSVWIRSWTVFSVCMSACMWPIMAVMVAVVVVSDVVCVVGVCVGGV